MGLKGRWQIVILVVLVIVGIDGLIRALPKASESVGDLLVDAAIIAGIVAFTVIMSRLYGRHRRSPK